MAPRSRSLMERFEDKYIPEPNSGCWIWTGEVGSFGYGVLTISQKWRDGRRFCRVSARAHRLSWELHCGPIPDGLFVCHSCDFPPCVNPDHLFLGDDAANVADCISKGRNSPPPIHSGETHHKAKLKIADVIDIKKRRMLGYEYAEKYGVTPALISAIHTGKIWRHVTATAEGT